MKLSRFFLPALVLGVLLCFTSATSFAQGSVAPNQQLGIGINTDGFAISYALSPAFQIGTDFGVTSVTGDGTGSGTTIDFGPYGRFLFEGIVNPFVQVGFGLTKPGSGDAFTSLYAAGGLEYFLNQNVGIHGELNLIAIPFQSGASSVIGFRAGRVGLEWWFRR